MGDSGPVGYEIGGASVAEWIREATGPGLTVGSAIPPGYASYGTVVIPEYLDAQRLHDVALVKLLRNGDGDQHWWLGYLETGGATIPFKYAPRVRLYSGWRYALVDAGPVEALAWRRGEERSLPDLMFPHDRSWLMSTLWDDDWRCVGGDSSLLRSLVNSEDLDAREVQFDEDATPPGHTAF